MTGAAGFIGSHVARSLLNKGIEVIGVDNFNDYYSVRTKEWNSAMLTQDFPQSFRLVRGNLLDASFLSELFLSECFDKVCHLAARAGVRESIQKPHLYEETNVRGTLNLLELSKQHGIRQFVYASSSSVYGECQTMPFTESMKLEPIPPTVPPN